MFYDRVYRTAYLMTNDHYLSQDVVQETFEKAFKQLHKLKDPEKTGAWLATIATTTAIDMIRKKNKGNEFVTEDVFISREQSNDYIEEEIERVFLIKIIRSHLAQLKEEYKQVIILKYIYELKDEEIANELGMKVGTVKSRIRRAKLLLKQTMGSLAEVKEGRMHE